MTKKSIHWERRFSCVKSARDATEFTSTLTFAVLAWTVHSVKSVRLNLKWKNYASMEKIERNHSRALNAPKTSFQIRVSWSTRSLAKACIKVMAAKSSVTVANWKLVSSNLRHLKIQKKIKRTSYPRSCRSSICCNTFKKSVRIWGHATSASTRLPHKEIFLITSRVTAYMCS